MPRVTVGNKEIVVNFQHGQAPSNYSGKRTRPPTDYTRCVILSGTSGCRDENKTKNGEATVRRYYKDTPNLKAARLNALNMAVSVSGLSKDERAAVYGILRK